MFDVQLPGATVTVGELVAELTAVLGHSDSPRRDAQDILAMLLDVSRTWAAMHRLDEVPDGLADRAREAARQRARGMPIQYATGKAAFRHLVLDVDPRVLIPRSETEGLVELVLGGVSHTGGTVVDVGTGSGAVALALASEGRFARVIGTDISADALAVAASNARRVDTRTTAAVEFRLGAGLGPVRGVTARAVVSNPPYISWDEAARLPASVRDWEPPIALVDGVDGLWVTKALIEDAPQVLECGGLLAIEVDERRAGRVADLLAADGRYTEILIGRDLAGRERFVTARRAERM